MAKAKFERNKPHINILMKNLMKKAILCLV